MHQLINLMGRKLSCAFYLQHYLSFNVRRRQGDCSFARNNIWNVWYVWKWWNHFPVLTSTYQPVVHDLVSWPVYKRPVTGDLVPQGSHVRWPGHCWWWCSPLVLVDFKQGVPAFSRRLPLSAQMWPVTWQQLRWISDRDDKNKIRKKNMVKVWSLWPLMHFLASSILTGNSQPQKPHCWE